MIITMLLNGILKAIDNNSLSSRVLICVDSKLQSISLVLVPVELKEIKVLKNEDASCEILFRSLIWRGKVALTSSMSD